MMTTRTLDPASASFEDTLGNRSLNSFTTAVFVRTSYFMSSRASLTLPTLRLQTLRKRVSGADPWLRSRLQQRRQSVKGGRIEYHRGG